MSRRYKRSLQSIILLSLILFSIVPLSFLTGYSLVKYEQAIDDELKKRLEGNTREVGIVLEDLEQHLFTTGRLHASDPGLVQAFINQDRGDMRRLLSQWMKNYIASRVSVFARDGRRLLSLQKENGKIEVSKEDQSAEIYLSESTLQNLRQNSQFKLRELRKETGVEIVVYTRITDRRGNSIGYLEEILSLGEEFLKGLKKRLKLEILVLDEKLVPLVSSHPDLLLYPPDFIANQVKTSPDQTYEMNIRDEPYGFMVRPVRPGDSSIWVGLGASKKDVRRVIQRINLALVTVGGGLVLLLIPILWWISRIVSRPVSNLVEAAQRLAGGQNIEDLKIESTTEIGALTESFNLMKNRIVDARRDLEKKVVELERTNKELQQTQSQLIHSAKMVSLGQLVAGVAHELNNPIGYIYSNMTHLRDYADRLAQLIQVAEKDPSRLAEKKAELEYEYVMEDLPKLIKACEDGALRTRDIVLGLRNFSRLDEASIKEVDLESAIRDTLKLLSGEIKTRIRVHEDFEGLPLVRCFASHINQVFMNILSNAVQAIEGSGDIYIKTRSEDGKVHVSIRDTGAGIPKEVMEKIFDPFFTTKPVGQGTGLGLSISYGIIKKHNGEIFVESQPGQGTEFRVVLPIQGP